MRRSFRYIPLLLLWCICLSGCFLFFRKKSLKGIKLRKVEVRLASGSPALCPGQKDRLVIDAITDEGERLSTIPNAHSKTPLGWNNFALNMYGGDVDEKGNIKVTDDVKELWTHPVSVKAAVVHDASKEARRTIKVTFSCPYVVNHSGESGPSGREGRSGRAGRDGSSHSSSGSSARPGGYGGSGGYGGPGSDGRHGSRGDDLRVRVTFIKHPKTRTSYLQVIVDNLTQKNQQFFLLHPRGGRITISADGGHGGSGGRGGRGGHGGRGGTGLPNGNSGSGGDGGDGGNGGDGADGGRIFMLVDPAARSYLKLITLSNKAGSGGGPGAAGVGGSKGAVFSGARAGDNGRFGRKGTNYGRSGRPGPEPEIRFQRIQPVLMKAPPRAKSFADDK